MELEIYYEVLQNADQNWYEGENDPKPFIKYMLGIILSCYREFEARIVLAEKTGWWGCYDYTAGHTGVFVEYGGSSDWWIWSLWGKRTK